MLKKCYFYDPRASVQYKYTCTINPHSEEPKQSGKRKEAESREGGLCWGDLMDRIMRGKQGAKGCIGVNQAEQ